MKKESNHILDKNHKYCVVCGMKVIKEEFIPATEDQQELFLKNPYQFIKNLTN
jgi:hypothetical protein